MKSIHKSILFIVFVFFWNFTSLYPACEHEKKVVLVPHGSGYYIKDDTVFFPHPEAPGREVYPAFRPKEYLRTNFRVSKPKPSQGPAAYIIGYFGKPGAGHDDFLEMVEKFRKDGFDVTIEEGSFREKVPPYKRESAYFQKDGIAGSFWVTSFHDSNCQKWSIIEYLFNIQQNI